MSRQRIHWNNRDHDRQHRAKLISKLQKIQTLQALLEEWESYYAKASKDKPHPNLDHAYILQLRRKLRSLEHQYNAMSP